MTISSKRTQAAPTSPYRMEVLKKKKKHAQNRVPKDTRTHWREEIESPDVTESGEKDAMSLST